MKPLYNFVTVILIGVLVPSVSFTQNTNGLFWTRFNSKLLLQFSQLNAEKHKATADSRDMDDLLIAERGIDSWEINNWVGEDSIEYAYDPNNNRILRLVKRWTGSLWKDLNKETNEYDASNNLTLTLRYSWNGTDWILAYQTVFTYDANNNSVSELEQSWSGNAWVNYYRRTSVFDANNNQLSEIKQDWQGNTWTNGYRYLYTYDTNNRLISDTYQLWNGTVWENKLKRTYTYDANDNQLSDLRQEWAGNAWENKNRYTNEFDANNNPTLELGEKWLVNAWVNSYRDLIDLDNHHWEEQTWDGDNWIPSLQINFVTDANNNTTEAIFQWWNAASWQNASKVIQDFDAGNNQTRWLQQEWTDDSIWVNHYRSLYYYQIITNTSAPAPSDFQCRIFPNPGKGVFTIDAATKIAAQAKLNIYNTIGQQVYSRDFQAGNPIGSLDLRFLPNGTYLLQILMENRQSAQIFVIAP